MSTDRDLPDEVDPAEGWECAGRQLLAVEGERVEKEAQEISRQQRQLRDPSLNVGTDTAHDVQQLIYRLERLSKILAELDPRMD
jgi:hypothetical protein